MSTKFAPTAMIKLVIWDLDDTFWKGTLTEGGVAIIQGNVELVKELARRGIISSISSKNDYDDAKRALVDAGIWDYFVFPRISFSSKGPAIKSIIEDANLRPDNVLFIDDNEINLREVKFMLPQIMAALPDDVIPYILEVDEAKGKQDSSLSRLAHYKSLEMKVHDRENAGMNNEDFLRQCDIRVQFDYDIEQHFDRVIELINRSNQLNYTKKRLDTADKISQFRRDLSRHDIFSGIVSAKDKYGDHGIIGFYMQFKNERKNKLVHFVFSCRMMNVGLEQFVYEHLGEPEIDIVQPVSNPIKEFDAVSWIKEADFAGVDTESHQNLKLLLIGSCDLTAVATYCSRNRREFVNTVKDGVMVRYDDFGFIIGSEVDIRKSSILPLIPCWTSQDFEDFQAELSDSRVVILSLSSALKGYYLVSSDDVVVRIHPEGMGDYIDVNPGLEFLKHCKFYELGYASARLLLEQSLDSIDARTKSASTVIMLGANTRTSRHPIPEPTLSLLNMHNDVAKGFCDCRPNWHFASIDDIISEENLVDDRHYTRLGYYTIAKFVMGKMSDAGNVAVAKPTRAIGAAASSIKDVIRAGREVSRNSLFGHQRGAIGHLKRVVKISPFSGLVRKVIGKEVVASSVGGEVV